MQKNPEFPTPEAAEAAYIRAFQASDLDAMMNVWADEEDIVCTHPIAARQQQGRAAVLEGWLGVFARELDVQVLLLEVRRIRHGDIAIHCGEEHILTAGEGALRGINNFTNVFKKTPRGWKIIVHHASPGRAPGQAARPPKPDSMPGSHLH